MADGNGGATANKGVLAYNWVLSIGVGLISLLSLFVLDIVRDTAKTVNDLRARVEALGGVVDSRFNAHAERLTGHDRRFERIEDRLSLAPAPPSFRNTP